MKHTASHGGARSGKEGCHWAAHPRWQPIGTAGSGPGLMQRDEDGRQVSVELTWEGTQVPSFILWTSLIFPVCGEKCIGLFWPVEVRAAVCADGQITSHSSGPGSAPAAIQAAHMGSCTHDSRSNLRALLSLVMASEPRDTGWGSLFLLPKCRGLLGRPCEGNSLAWVSEYLSCRPRWH